MEKLLSCPFVDIFGITMVELPSDILGFIFGKLEKKDLPICRLVCKRFRKLVKPVKGVTCRDYVDNLYILKFVYSLGCPIPKNATHAAVVYGNLDSLRWLRWKGANFDLNLYWLAKRKGLSRIMKYLEAIGFGPIRAKSSFAMCVVF